MPALTHQCKIQVSRHENRYACSLYTSCYFTPHVRFFVACRRQASSHLRASCDHHALLVHRVCRPNATVHFRDCDVRSVDHTLRDQTSPIYDCRTRLRDYCYPLRGRDCFALIRCSCSVMRFETHSGKNLDCRSVDRKGEYTRATRFQIQHSEPGYLRVESSILVYRVVHSVENLRPADDHDLSSHRRARRELARLHCRAAVAHRHDLAHRRSCSASLACQIKAAYDSDAAMVHRELLTPQHSRQ